MTKSTPQLPADFGWQLLRGMKDLLPAFPAIFMFGAGFGALAAHSIGAWAAVLMSLLVFAGSAQMAVLPIWHEANAFAGILMVTLAVNCRHVAFGATLAGRLRGAGRAEAFACLAVLSDLNWAATMSAGLVGRSALYYLAGGGLIAWIAWVAGTAAGAFAPIHSQAIESLGIDALMPGFFACILAGQLRRKQSTDVRDDH